MIACRRHPERAAARGHDCWACLKRRQRGRPLDPPLAEKGSRWDAVERASRALWEAETNIDHARARKRLKVAILRYFRAVHGEDVTVSTHSETLEG